LSRVEPDSYLSSGGYHPEYDPYSVARPSLPASHGESQSFASLETQTFEYHAQSEPTIHLGHNAVNQFQGLAHSSNIAYHDPQEMSGCIEQAILPSLDDSQGLDDWFNDPTIIYRPLNEPPHIADENLIVPLDHDNAVHDPVAKARYECNWPGCDRTFSREADRDRHVRTKHGNARHYHCSQPGCNKGALYWRGYTRIDKLQEHMRKKHPGVVFRGIM
jgi:hypothetical protein